MTSTSSERVRARHGQGPTARRTSLRHGFLRLGLLAATALATVLAATPPAAAVADGAGPAAATETAQSAEPHAFDIAPQPLDRALLAFSDATGVQVFFGSEVARDVASPGVSGTYAPDEALRRLLAGTGLRHRFTADQIVTVERASAEDGTGPLRLGPVTVLGSRQAAEVPLSNVPASITYVDREEIRSARASAPRIEDILGREVPGFNPTNNGIRQIRGRTAQVFINGVPVNEQLRASSGSDLNLVTPEQLDAIEVSRGANSAYGFGSPGGIIALSTPRAESRELSLRSSVGGSFNPHHPGGSYRSRVYQSAAQIVGDFDYHVAGALGYDGNEFAPSGERSLGFDSPNGLANNKEWLGSADASLGYDLGEGRELRLAATYNYVDILEAYSLDGAGTYRETQSSVVRDPVGDDGYRMSRTINLGYQQDDLWGSALKIEAFNSDTYTETYSLVGGRVSRDEQTNQYYGVRSAVTTPLDGISQGMSATWGVDAIRNRYFRPVYWTDDETIRTYFAPDVTLDTVAPYLQVEVPVGPVKLSGGVRHERYSGSTETNEGDSGIEGGDIESFDLTLYNVGVLYPLDAAVDLFATFTQGAEVTQLGRAARSASTAAEIDPQPAKSDQYEVGARGDWKDLSLSAAAFYTESDLMNSLVCDGVNPCTPLREPRKIWGVEGKADWQYDEQWSFGGLFTWQDGIRYPEGETARRLGGGDNPPLLVGAYVGYDPEPWWRNTLHLDYRHSRAEFGDSTAFDEGRVDSVLLFHVASEFDVAGGVLRLGVHNLLNTRYFSIPASSGNNGFTWVPEEGTRVSASYSLEW